MNFNNKLLQIIPQIIATRMLEKVRQLTIQIHFNVDSTLEECRENIRNIRSIEDYGFVRFSSKTDLNSFNRHNGMRIDDYLTYTLTWYNPYLNISMIYLKREGVRRK